MSRPNVGNIIFSKTLAASRESYFLFCEGLRHLTPPCATVPKVSHICTHRSSVYRPGTMLRRSLSYRFSICFPHFSLSKTENDGKTIEYGTNKWRRLMVASTNSKTALVQDGILKFRGPYYQLVLLVWKIIFITPIYFRIFVNSRIVLFATYCCIY